VAPRPEQAIHDRNACQDDVTSTLRLDGDKMSYSTSTIGASQDQTISQAVAHSTEPVTLHPPPSKVDNLICNGSAKHDTQVSVLSGSVGTKVPSRTDNITNNTTLPNKSLTSISRNRRWNPLWLFSLGVWVFGWASGRVMYHGAVGNVPSYFGDRGHPCPPNYNPADWIMNVAQSVDLAQLNKAGFSPEDTRALATALKENVDGKDELGITLTEHHLSQGYDDTPVGMIGQVSMLFTLEIRNLYRDAASIGARFGLTIFLSLLVGIIFLTPARVTRQSLQ
jgi:hypothetical protein